MHCGIIIYRLYVLEAHVMTLEQFKTKNFNHAEVVDAISKPVKRQLNSYESSLEHLKITDINDEGMLGIALSRSFQNNHYSLWRLRFTFENMENWKDYVIQNSARLEEFEELPERSNYIEILGFTEKEADAECFKFFLLTRTFEHKWKISQIEKSGDDA